MNVASVAQMIPVLQTAIGPMILISGLGLILLTTTNRLGRTIDRVRILTAELPTVTENKRAKISAQLAILWRRARLIRMAILGLHPITLRARMHKLGPVRPETKEPD